LPACLPRHARLPACHPRLACLSVPRPVQHASFYPTYLPVCPVCLLVCLAISASLCMPLSLSLTCSACLFLFACAAASLVLPAFLDASPFLPASPGFPALSRFALTTCLALPNYLPLSPACPPILPCLAASPSCTIYASPFLPGLTGLLPSPYLTNSLCISLLAWPCLPSGPELLAQRCLSCQPCLPYHSCLHLPALPSSCLPACLPYTDYKPPCLNLLACLPACLPACLALQVCLSCPARMPIFPSLPA
jgi:hypothetical protein